MPAARNEEDVKEAAVLLYRHPQLRRRPARTASSQQRDEYAFESKCHYLFE